MKKTFIVSFFIFFFTPSNSIYSQNNCADFIQKVRISDKVLVVGIGDAIISILTQKGIIVIDAGQSPTLTEQYKKIIEREFSRKDFAYLINTHSHHDHTGGNRIFADIKIIGHKNCAEEITNYWKDPERIRKGYQRTIDQLDKRLNSPEIDQNTKKEALIDKCRYITVLNDIKTNENLTLPNLSFSDTMSLDMGDMTLNLIYFGKAHTTSDILIYIPEEKLLLIGDLFMKGGNPSFKFNDQKEIEYGYNVLNSLIKKNNIQTIITGHGDILSSNDLFSFYENIKDAVNTSQMKDDLKAVERSINNVFSWAIKKDFNLFFQTIADDSAFISVTPYKRVKFGIKDVLKDTSFWGSVNFKAIRHEIHDLKINFSNSGDIAWFYCVLDDINEWKGQPANWENARWTGVLEKRNSKWRIVQQHFSFAQDK